jgi:tubulin---tyrosine ligase
VKPGELTNRGNGITVIDEIYELDGIMKAEKKHNDGSEKTFIVQLYIDRPFLYKKRKFDIRHYLMVTQLHGVFKAFWFK